MLRLSISRFIRVSYHQPSTMSAPFSAGTGSVPVVQHNAKESKFYIKLDGNGILLNYILNSFELKF